MPLWLELDRSQEGHLAARHGIGPPVMESGQPAYLMAGSSKYSRSRRVVRFCEADPARLVAADHSPDARDFQVGSIVANGWEE